MPSVVAPARSGRVPDHAVRGPDPSAPTRLSAARAPSLLNLAALECWRCPLEVYSTIRARSPRGRSVPAAGADHASFFQTYHELRRARDCGELPDRDRTRAEEPPEKTRPAADDDDDDPFGPPGGNQTARCLQGCAASEPGVRLNIFDPDRRALRFGRDATLPALSRKGGPEPPLSARSRFLAECVDRDLEPRAGFLLRRQKSRRPERSVSRPSRRPPPEIIQIETSGYTAVERSERILHGSYPRGSATPDDALTTRRRKVDGNQHEPTRRRRAARGRVRVLRGRVTELVAS